MTHQEKAARRLEIARAIASGAEPSKLACTHGLTIKYLRDICEEMGVPWVAAKQLRKAKQQIETVGGK